MKIKILIFQLLGLTSACSCIAYVGMGKIISAYSLMLILANIILLYSKKVSFNILTSTISFQFITWIILAILSAIFGFYFFINEDEWRAASISSILKILIYLLFFYLLIRTVDRRIYIHALLRGLIYGVIINAIWAICDAVIFYTYGFSITNDLFKSYITAADTRYGMLSLVYNGTMRSGGLNGDPANIGMFAPILASYSLYSKKYWLYVITIMSIMASISIVGLVSTLVITIIYFFTNLKRVIYGIIGLFLLTCGILYIYDHSNDITYQMISGVLERLESKTDGSELEGLRGKYWTEFIPAVLNSPINFFIGTGYNTASFAYIKGGFVDTDFPYDPEQTYFSNFFNLGLIGFLFYVSMHLNVLRISSKRKFKNDYLMVFAGMEGIMISFMGYHYTLYSVSTLFLIAGVILISIESTKNPILVKELRK